MKENKLQYYRNKPVKTRIVSCYQSMQKSKTEDLYVWSVIWY